MAKTQEAEKPLIKMTLPELLGSFVKRVTEDPKQANSCGQDLQMWHDANVPLEDKEGDKTARVTWVQEQRKTVERGRQVMDYLFSQYIQIVQKDLQ